MLQRAQLVDWASTKPYLYRVFHRDVYCAKAEDFRHFGPVARYDHHLPGPAGEPEKSATRSCVYLAETPGTALAEVFGDDRVVDACPNWMVARVEVTNQVPLLDLTDSNVMLAGAYASILALDREHSQEWARKAYTARSDICGIAYVGSHDYGRCYVLWDRAKRKRPNRDIIRTKSAPNGSRFEYSLDRVLESQAATALSSELQRALTDRKLTWRSISARQCSMCSDPNRNP